MLLSRNQVSAAFTACRSKREVGMFGGVQVQRIGGAVIATVATGATLCELTYVPTNLEDYNETDGGGFGPVMLVGDDVEKVAKMIPAPSKSSVVEAEPLQIVESVQEAQGRYKEKFQFVMANVKSTGASVRIGMQSDVFPDTAQTFRPTDEPIVVIQINVDKMITLLKAARVVAIERDSGQPIVRICVWDYRTPMRVEADGETRFSGDESQTIEQFIGFILPLVDRNAQVEQNKTAEQAGEETANEETVEEQEKEQEFEGEDEVGEEDQT